MKIFRDEEAVSPVIGVILMVAITVILAAVIAAFVFGLGGQQQQAPTASIVAANNPDTPAPDMKIQHKGGDTLKGGDWKISIVSVTGTSTSPIFVKSAPGSDLSVGSQINVSSMTDGAATADNTSVKTGTPLVSGQKYDVKLVHIPSNAMMLDTVVEVR